MPPHAPSWTENRSKAPIELQHELLLKAWECALVGGSTVYLSGPITTGPRFVDWYRRVGRRLKADRTQYEAQLQRDVIEPNSRDIRDFAVRLRAELHEAVLEPASLFVDEWTQDEYLTLWSRVIERFAARIVMMPGWEYSKGCAAELHRAFVHGLPASTLDGVTLSLKKAIHLLRLAVEDIESDAVPVENLGYIADELGTLLFERSRALSAPKEVERLTRKDASLDRLAETINVAQFVSFSPARVPTLCQEYSRVLGLEPNHRFKSVRHALGTLLERSAENSINLRSFTPDLPQSREFIYGIRSLDDAVGAAERLGSEGLFVIANETVDVHDGGVSGVLMGDVLEFSPDDTPRSVEKPGVASLPRLWGIEMLSIAYGFSPDLDVPRASRLEFSIHPRSRGWRHTHTLGWEYAPAEPSGISAKLNWPNRFSRMIGDKVFGLLVAHLAGLPVPRATIINRRIAPFIFGRPTGSSEVWLRTSPHEQVPGKFTTTKGWVDPFRLLQDEDPDGTQMASILCQAAVPSAYAGAAIVTADNRLVVEGKAGEGDVFMKGVSPPEKLPDIVLQQVEALHRRASNMLGPVRFEWAFDGQTVWVVQLHRGATQSTAGTLVPGEADRWVVFDVERGLDHLREMIKSLESGAGLLVRGEVGLTSHVADIIRRAGVPARLGSTT